MDRFIRQWSAASAVAHASLDREPISLIEDDDHEEDLDDFIVPDEDEDEDDVYGDAEREYDAELTRSNISTVHLAKKMKLQPKLTTNGNANAVKKKSNSNTPAAQSSAKPSCPPSNTQASSSSSKKKERRQEEKQSAKQAFRQMQQERKAADTSAILMRETSKPIQPASSQAQARPTPPAAAASSIPPVGSTAPSRIVRTNSAPSVPPAAAAPSGAATSSSSTTLVPTTSTSTLTRKRRHVLIDSDSADERDEIERMIESIEDDPPADEKGRTASAVKALTIPDPSPPKAPSTPLTRNILGILNAMRRNEIPFGNLHHARLKRLQDDRMAEKERLKDSTAAMENDNDTAGGITSSRCLAPIGPQESFPFYATSSFRHRHIRDQMFLHYSLRKIWSEIQPVQRWSVCGSFGGGIDALRDRPRVAGAQISYVNQIEFDHSADGMLFTATSNNAKLNLYDFDLIWQAGRSVETGARASVLRERERVAKAEELRRIATSNSPPRTGKWTLRQPIPAIRPASATRKKNSHEYLQPTFSMDLHPDSRPAGTAAAAQGQNQSCIRQIDSHHWNPFNHNEVAVASQRNSAVYIFDLTRCDEFGSPHRRVHTCDTTNQSQSGSGIMDFQFFPAYGSHASTHTLVSALRNGEVNVVDLRVPNGQSSTDWTGSSVQTKLFRAQARSTSAPNQSRLTLNESSTSPVSVVVSGCGNRMHVFTEAGGVEVWDSRNMRAAYESLTMIDAVWKESNPGATASYASAVGAGSAPSSFGLEFRRPSGRVCSATAHPQDDLVFTFQLLNGCVGMLDLNPSSSGYRTCTSIVSFDADFVSACDEYALRTRRTHAFLPNGQGGTKASARREKMMAVCNTRNQIQVWESCTAPSCCPSTPVRTVKSIDPMMSRELARSSNASAARVNPSSLHLLQSFSFPPTQATDMVLDAYGPPIMSLAVHPRVPCLLVGTKDQQIRIAAHTSEIEQIDQDEDERETIVVQ